MKKTSFKIFVALFFGIVFLSTTDAWALASVSKGAAPSSSFSSAAPDFSLMTVANKNVSLKDFKGKNVMLFFFATWCPGCRDKFPDLIKNTPAFTEEGIELLVIDAGESAAKVAAFVQKKGVPFDILLDRDMKVAVDYDVVGVPTFIFIAKDGRVLFAGNDLPKDYARIYNRPS
jgi:peroxiredoxin